jgi:mono/diheme cytochrome c family protein
MAVPPKRRRWSGPAAEGGLVVVVVGLLFVAALAGFLVGRDSAENDGTTAAAETTTTAESAPAPTTTEAATTSTQGEEADGAAVFAEAGCGGCHTFGPANSSGTVGPRLDGVDLSKDEIAQQVRNGGGGMPAFGGRLSDAEIEAVADYVESG